MFNEDKDEDEDNDVYENKLTYKESPFKPIIVDVRNKLSKNGNKLIKRGLYYVEEMKEYTEPHVNNIKEKLIGFKKNLIIIMASNILDICLMNMKMNMKISDI